jgi:hypothetical protein
MKKPIVRLSYPFSNRMVGQMAVVANGDVPMTRVLPRIVVTLHDMTIGTHGWVIAQITPAFGISKSERTDAAKNAEDDCQKERKEHVWPDQAAHQGAPAAG